MKKVRDRIKRYTLSVKLYFKSEAGGGFGIVFLGMGAILLAFIILINIADYSILTYKRNAISKSMDYAINAAVQEISINESMLGLAGGFSEASGNRSVDGVKVDIDRANKTFLAVFYENCNSNEFSVENNLLLCTTHMMEQKLNYVIKAGNRKIDEGELEDPEFLESRINQVINQYWSNSDDHSQTYINGNENTNMIENGTYLFAFIKDIKIQGLYSQRTTSLSSFAGAKIERQIVE